MLLVGLFGMQGHYTVSQSQRSLLFGIRRLATFFPQTLSNQLSYTNTNRPSGTQPDSAKPMIDVMSQYSTYVRKIKLAPFLNGFGFIDCMIPHWRREGVKRKMNVTDRALQKTALAIREIELP